MKKIFLYFIISALLWQGIAVADDMKEMGSQHFICHFAGDEAFAKDVLDKAEGYYKDIALGIGYPRYSDFWTYDNRVEIYIYADKATFAEVTGQPEWSCGMADFSKREIVGYLWSEEFLDSVLPHEMAHLIFRDFVGFTGKIPLWLDEGVAQWAEAARRDKMKAMVKELYEEDKLLSLEDLTKLDIRKFKTMDRVYIRATRDKEGRQVALFLSTDALVGDYYLVSVSLINFLIDRYGSDRFAHFCRGLRDGKTVGGALKFAYSPSITDIDDLETKWRQYLAEE